MKPAVVLMLTLLLVPAVYAQEETISADRPGFADGPDVVGSKTFQIEAGVGVEDQDGTFVNVPTLARIGLSDRLELRIESDLVTIDDGEHDLAPFSVGFKWNFAQGDRPLSLIGSLQPPSGEGASRSDGFEGEARIVSNIELADGLSFVPNAGVTAAEGGTYGAVVAASLEMERGNAVPFVDFELSSDKDDTSAIADAGIAWIVGTEMQLDVSGGVRLTGDGYSDWFIGAGVSRRFRGFRR